MRVIGSEYLHPDKVVCVEECGLNVLKFIFAMDNIKICERADLLDMEKVWWQTDWATLYLWFYRKYVNIWKKGGFRNI